jgi:hypothetical protein
MSSPPLTHGKGPRSTIHCLIGGSGTRQCADILPSPRVVRPGRNPVYPADLQPFLVMCWSVIRGTAGKLLAAATPAISSRCCAQSCLLTAIRSQSDQETPQGPRPTSRGWPTAASRPTPPRSLIRPRTGRERLRWRTPAFDSDAYKGGNVVDAASLVRL